MARLIRFALAVELLLVIAEALFHPSWLPLGGHPCAQLGIVLGLAICCVEIYASMRDPEDDDA